MGPGLALLAAIGGAAFARALGARRVRRGDRRFVPLTMFATFLLAVLLVVVGLWAVDAVAAPGRARAGGRAHPGWWLAAGVARPVPIRGSGRASSRPQRRARRATRPRIPVHRGVAAGHRLRGVGGGHSCGCCSGVASRPRGCVDPLVRCTVSPMNTYVRIVGSLIALALLDAPGVGGRGPVTITGRDRAGAGHRVGLWVVLRGARGLEVGRSRAARSRSHRLGPDAPRHPGSTARRQGRVGRAPAPVEAHRHTRSHGYSGWRRPALHWTLYHVQSLTGLVADIAFSEHVGGTYVVVLQSQATEAAGLHDSVFLPAVDAFAPATAASQSRSVRGAAALRRGRGRLPGRRHGRHPLRYVDAARGQRSVPGHRAGLR